MRLAFAVLVSLALPASAAASPTSEALDALARAGLPADRAEVTHVRRGALGVHVRGVEARDGVPVDGTGWVVTSRDGEVVDVALDRSRLPGTPTPRPVGARAARAAALGALDADHVRTQRLLVARAGRLRDTYRVTVLARTPAFAGSFDVDAATGEVVALRHDEQSADATAKVFDPNPVVTRRDATLRQPLELRSPADADLDSPELTAERFPVAMRGLDDAALATGRLTGPWVDVVGMGGYVLPSGSTTFDITRGDPRFEGLMAYAHLDRLQRYFQDVLGFTGEGGVNAESQQVVATRVEGFDNSFYQPRTDVMLLGTGGVDDGEDAEVIVHEYGHAVHDAQVPGWGRSPQGGAMGEGFGDFLAGAYYARDRSGGFQDLCIMDWDATTYSDGTPPCLRRMDTGKRYPQDLRNQVHADGELWSEFLWRVRARLGTTSQERTDAALRLLLASHELLTPQADFAAAVAALQTTADALGRPDWRVVVTEEAQRTGFLVS